MRIGLPLLEDKGLESTIYPQFEKAPYYLFWDEEKGSYKVESREALQSREGAFLEEFQRTDSAILTPALSNMGFKVWKHYGIPVYRIPGTKNVSGALEVWRGGEVLPFTEDQTASQNSCSSSCSTCSSTSCS